MTETGALEPEIVEPNTTVAVDMVIENAELTAVDSQANDESNQKRARDDDEKGVSKKLKVEAEVEEEMKPSGPVKLGYKTFGTSLELFDYFNSFLHAWGPNLNVNKVSNSSI